MGVKLPDLKPCPYCGGHAYIDISFGKPHVMAHHTKKCLIRPDTWLISNESLSKQIKAWNRRKEKQMLFKRIEELAREGYTISFSTDIFTGNLKMQLDRGHQRTCVVIPIEDRLWTRGLPDHELEKCIDILVDKFKRDHTPN